MTIRTQLQKQAQSSLIQYALLRWEGALVLALSLVLAFLLPAPFPWWPHLAAFGWGWLVLGLLGYGAIALSSLADSKNNARLLLNQFQQQFNPQTLRTDFLRQDVERALEYQKLIEEQVQSQPAGMMRSQLEETAGQISAWVNNVHELAQRLDSYRQDSLLQQERKTLPREIEQLTAQQKLEDNEDVAREMGRLIESKGQHWQSVRALDERMQQAQLQLDQSVTALATLHSQIRLIDSRAVSSGQAQRLQADISEQTARLDDLVSGINDVYDHSTPGVG